MLVVACTNSTNNDNIVEKTFTIDELSTYNGKDGNPAYIAVEGIV